MRIVVTDPTMIQNLVMLRDRVRSDVEWRTSNPTGEQLWDLLPQATVFVGSPFTKEMAEKTEQLRLIQLAGAGTGGVDFSNLPENVIVANTYNHERSIAEYVVMCMLALTRRLLVADRELRQGNWYAVRHDATIPLPHTLQDKTVGIMGFGHIGQQVALLSKSLGMRVSAIKNRPSAQLEKEFGLAFLGGPDDLSKLLEESDYLVVALPQSAETENMIDQQALERMKPGAFIINVARGPIINEQALYDALENKRIAGAAIDTWYQYPGESGKSMPATLPFHKLDNAILTPHTSGETLQTNQARLGDIADNINRLLAGKPLRNVVYP